MKHRTYLLLIAATCFWGVGFPIAKIGVEYIHPFCFAFIRFLLVSVLFAALFRLNPAVLFEKLRRNLRVLILMALSGIFLYGVFFLYALRFAKASDVSLISGANPIITAIIAWFVLKERLTALGVLGIVLSFLGIVFIVSKGNLGILLRMDFNAGDLLMLFATTMWAIYTVITKRSSKELTTSEAVCLVSFLGALMFLPLALFKCNPQMSYPLKAWGSLAYMVLFSTVFAFSAWYKGIAEIGASRASVFVNLVPVFGVITSVLLLNERLSLYELLGGLLVITGVIMTNKRAHNAYRVRK
ncbi:DMT family transporter [Hippea sp. KM1]|uniref:DMT family transporter n=1 Tax=Hippea sp. KM1 TaxID=944481 RepID=UPI00046CFAB1|nr:DMT family transporter [Hippea sp. KM1]